MALCSTTCPVIESVPMRSLTLLTAIAVFLFMSTGITGPVNSLYVASLGASYVTIGLLGAVTAMTSILFSYLWGRLSDRLGQRKVLLVSSLWALALSYGLTAAVQDYRQLFPLRILAAMAQAAYGTSSLALVGDLLEGRDHSRGRRMGVYRGLCSLGFGAMAFMSGALADKVSLRAPYIGAAVVSALAASIAVLVRERSPDRPGETTDASQVGYDDARDQAAWAPGPPQLSITPLLVSALLWSLVTGAVYAVWANYMVDEIGYTRTAMSRLWALASLSELPLMIFAGWLSDRLGRLSVLGMSFVAWALVFIGYVLAPGMPWIVFVQLTRGFAYSAFTATAMTYAAEVRARSERGAASGLYHSATGLGAILGSSIGGALAQFTSLQTMILTNAVLISGAAAYLLSFSRLRSRRRA